MSSLSGLSSFTSLTFLFRFLPVFLILYHLVPAKWKNPVAFLGSMIFYAAGEPVLVFLLIALIGINHVLAAKSYEIPAALSKEVRKAKSRGYMIAAVLTDLAVLVFFKAAAISPLSFAMPLGLSFYIFKMISYTVDVYNRKLYRRPSFLTTALYFSLFPQIQQGPIMRYDDGDFHEDKQFDIEKLEEGLKIFAIGFSMKLILADRIGILWNDLRMYGFDGISTPLAWLGAFSYTFELYFDFYGYSLMAAGLLMMMGYDFIRNFDHPYASVTISEFYRRWHMTLGSFFRDYVYIPLGGSRTGRVRLVRNLLIVWALTGIWHGNGWNFLVWGAILGIFVVLEKLFYGKWLEKHRLIGHLYVLLVIPLTWVVFAIRDLKELGLYMSRLFPFWGSASYVNQTDFLEYLKDYGALFIFGILLLLPKSEQLFIKHRKSAVVILLLTGLFWFGVYFAASRSGNPFMYLDF